MNELALFAGAGGGILGGHLLGWRTVCAVEIEDYPRRVLLQRQADGFLPRFPIWDDVTTFDGKPWRGKVDVVSGGFPCQDISAAGKGKGLDGERSGMWEEMARIICEVQPRYAFIENSPMLTIRGLDRVLCDLTKMGFDAKWGVLGAADVGANHQRDRIWIVGKLANTKELFGNGGNDNARISMERKTQIKSGNNFGAKDVAHSNGSQCQGTRLSSRIQQNYAGIRNNCSEILNATSLRQQGQGQHEQSIHSTQSSQRQANYAKSIGSSHQWAIEPNVGRVADGVAARVDRLKAIGNGQVPLCAATAWRLLTQQERK